MKLLLDEMWPASIAAQLRRRGNDVIAVTERDDLRSQLDRDIFEACQREGLILVTENSRDFRRIVVTHMLAGHTHAGCIYTTHRQFPRNDDRTAGRLIRALEKLLEEQPVFENIEHWLQAPN